MKHPAFPHRLLTQLLLVSLILAGFGPPAEAQRRKKPPRAEQKVGFYRSRNFVIRTDLEPKEAKELQTKLERMIGLVSKYYARRNPKPIHCFIVKDLKNWSEAELQKMAPDGYQKIADGAGVTKSATVRVGARFNATAVVYSIAGKDVPQHEAVHAYCAQAFGDTGPTWYAEGMAEVGKYWREKDASAVHCSDHVAKYLRTSEPKRLSEIVDPNQVTGDSWQNYAWRWALCHLLGNNPNYAQRFRPLGIGLMTGQRGVSFETVYGAMAKEIDFEYQLFLQHLEPGYRVDLCSWDWKAKYRLPTGNRITAAKIDSARGWQPTRMQVRKGERYEFNAAGTWKLEKGGDDLTADGDKNGRGKLVGIIFHDYQLSEPFELGAEGTFTAPADGNLLLRCADKWTEIADNEGTVNVKLKRGKAGTRE